MTRIDRIHWDTTAENVLNEARISRPISHGPFYINDIRGWFSKQLLFVGGWNRRGDGSVWSTEANYILHLFESLGKGCYCSMPWWWTFAPEHKHGRKVSSKLIGPLPYPACAFQNQQYPWIFPNQLSFVCGWNHRDNGLTWASDKQHKHGKRSRRSMLASLPYYVSHMHISK